MSKEPNPMYTITLFLKDGQELTHYEPIDADTVGSIYSVLGESEARFKIQPRKDTVFMGPANLIAYVIATETPTDRDRNAA